ncbi:hypothetical protein BGW37DRAFT_485839 [Umbelopsis sp. PMI_123]|nr:hypothetical protein BGW37DRAFT_485839 [Umbelopsis sp. PMI_123]
MHGLTPLHIVLLSANLFISLLVVLLNSLALAYFEVARHMSESTAIYITSNNTQDTPTSQTESRDYILIIIGMISSVTCLTIIFSDLRRVCCGYWKKNYQHKQRRSSIVVEMSAGTIVLVWWVAMITYILTSYDGFLKCAMVGPKDVTRRIYNGCYLMDGALGAAIISTIFWILTNVVAVAKMQEYQPAISKETVANAMESNFSV